MRRELPNLGSSMHWTEQQRRGNTNCTIVKLAHVVKGDAARGLLDVSLYKKCRG